MSWLNNFLSDNKKLSDKDIIIELLNSSKRDISMFSKAVTEAANPLLRTILTNQLNVCISDHFRLSDIAASKNWYNPFTSPGQLIKQDLQETDSLLQNGNNKDNQ